MARLSLKTKTTTNDLVVNIGTSVNDKTGDPLRTAFGKLKDSIDQAEANFIELYATTGADVAIPTQTNNGGKYLTTDGSVLSWGTVDTVAPTALVNGDNSATLGSSGNLTFTNGEQVKTNFLGGGLELSHSSDNTIGIYDGYARINTFTTGGTKRTWEFDDAGILTLPSNSYLESTNTNLKVGAQGTVTIRSNAESNLTTKAWTFGTEGKLTLPAGTTYEYLSVPLTGHGDGLAVLDFALVTDGVGAQWIASSPNPEGVGYSVGDTFTFDETFLGIPGASTTIEVLTIGEGGSIVEIGFSLPPLYPADIYRDSPINLQVGPESNRWTFGHTGTLTTPGDIQVGTGSYLRFPDSSFQGTAFVGDASRLYGNVDEDVEVTVRHRPAVSANCHIAVGDEFVADTEFNDDITVVQVGWIVNVGGTDYTVTAIDPAPPAWQYRITAAGATFVQGTTYTFTNPTATLKTWTFNQQTGTLRAPGGALLSSETAVVGEGDAYRDFSIEILNPTGTNEYRWLFDNTAGELTLPGALKFNDGASNITALDPTTSGGISGINVAGKDRAYISIGDNSAFSYSWDFRAFGAGSGDSTVDPTIQFPGGGWLREDVSALGTGGFDIPVQLGSQGAFTLTVQNNNTFPDPASTYNWIFGTDGNLTLPAGGDIVDSNGASVLGGGGGTTLPSNTTGYLKNDGSGTLSWDAITVPTTLGDLGITAGSNGQFLQTDGAGSYIWTDVSTLTAAGVAGSTVASTPGTFMLDFMGWSRIANSPSHTDWDQPYNIYLAFNTGNSEGLALHTKFLSMAAGDVFNFTFNHTTATGSYLEHTFSNLTLSGVVDSGGGNIIVTVDQNLYTLLQTYFDSGNAEPTVDVTYTSQFQNGQRMAITIPSISDKTWTFSNDGALTLPYNSVIQSVAGNITINSENYVYIDTTNGGQIEIGRNSATGTVILGQKSTTANVFVDGDLFVEAGVYEKFANIPTPATGVVIHNCANGHIFYHTSPDSDWTVNLTNFNGIVGRATSVTLVISQGATGYYPTALQIGGAAQTINWQGNTAPTPSVSRIDVVSLSILCTAPDTYTVLGQLTGF